MKADLIYAYTREQAIDDGVLIDVSEQAREAGFKFPVAVTQAVWNEYIMPDDRSRSWGQSEAGRLWDILTILRYRAKQGGETLLFSVYFVMNEKQRRLIELKAVCHPGDSLEPVITVMKLGED